MMDVSQKVTIISGASGGLGQVVSRVFYEAGASVVLIGSRPEGVQALADELGTERVLPVAADLVDPADAEAVVSTTLDALRGRANYSAYAISKAAILRLTESMAAEVKDYGITVNAILPGTIDTEANRQSMPQADFTKWVKPATIASALLFLASEDTAINGASIPLYGQS
jgi:NAD(P)-dependent dehydrogenase (short-subunit alcohol dehydrogenase family)